jgi:hypothetical protein
MCTELCAKYSRWTTRASQQAPRVWPFLFFTCANFNSNFNLVCALIMCQIRQVDHSSEPPRAWRVVFFYSYSNFNSNFNIVCAPIMCQIWQVDHSREPPSAKGLAVPMFKQTSILTSILTSTLYVHCLCAKYGRWTTRASRQAPRAWPCSATPAPSSAPQRQSTGIPMDLPRSRFPIRY